MASLDRAKIVIVLALAGILTTVIDVIAVISVLDQHNEAKEQLEKAETSIHELRVEAKEKDKLIEELQQIVESLQHENAQLEQELHEKDTFLKENKALRETVKTLSSRGAHRPRNFVLPQEPNILSDYECKEYVGTWTITFYTPTTSECGNSEGKTSSGKYVVPGYTAAVDNRHWKYGTLFYVDGWGVVEAMDTGGGIRGSQRADICIFDRNKALSFGRQEREVWLIERKSDAGNDSK